jgi:hypothetical protein
MSYFRRIAVYAGCSIAATALLGPDAAYGQRSKGARSDASEVSILESQDGDGVFQPAAYLDPNLDQPDASIRQLSQPGDEFFVPHSCGPHKGTFLTATWISGEDLGFTDFELTSKWGWFDVQNISLLTLTPGFGAHYPVGPDAPDLPGHLYDFYLDIKGLIPFSQTAAVEVGVTPGLYSDFEAGTDEALRVGARVVGYYVASPTLKFALGVLYLDRFDVEFLPVGGIIWTPDVDTNLELTFPRGKFARRFGCCCNHEDWWFVVAEFAGGAWAIERTTGPVGLVDVAAYRDLRFSVGWERRTPSGLTGSVEAGYVFNRHLEYKSGPEIEPDDAFMIKGTIGF